MHFDGCGVNELFFDERVYDGVGDIELLGERFDGAWLVVLFCPEV